VKRWSLPLALLVVATTLSGCTSTGGLDLSQLQNTITTVKHAVAPVDQQEEEEIGRDAAAILLGASKPIGDPAVQRYVNKVGLWVALQSERPDLNWHFAVVDSDDIDAFAAPGGYVFLTRGLLLHLHSEAELAGVLGHEITHVVLKHHLQELQRAARLDLASQAVQYQLQQNGQGGGAALFNQIAGATRNLYSKGLDKDDEFAADRAGVVLAARAGYDPYGLVAVLQTLESLDPKSGKLQLLIATHPTPSDRIAALTAAMGERLDKYGSQQEGQERFQRVIKSLAATSAVK